ncbi:MAG: diguanylate cyclase [Nitrospirae bacterium]|nr:diguanylate cyclase [Nitrospirota bacterium]
MSKATILLVEDNKMQADITKDYLSSNGYEVIWVQDGKSAIKIAKVQKIDVILLDLILPDLDGNEVARWLKVNNDTKGIPIIALTVKKSIQEKVLGLESGADDYLSKPYSELELNARIYSCMRTKALQDKLKEKNRQLEQVLAKVEMLAITDSLTEIYNRRYFETTIEREFIMSKRYNTPLSCLMIDIDYFKKINDEFGHRIGDIVLKQVAMLIKNCIRQADTVARWGGEEFIILLPNTKKENTHEITSRILKSVSVHKFPEIGRPITVSIGVAGIPDPEIDNPEKLINISDSALYQAKAKGRNRVAVL